MNYSSEVKKNGHFTKGPKHGPAPIPEEGKWVKSYEIKDIRSEPRHWLVRTVSRRLQNLP